VSFSILQCTTAYPTVPSEWGLNVISELKERYEVPIGFSDHSGDVSACIAAAALGCELFEFHVVFDKRMFGPDAEASLTIDQTARLVESIRQVKEALYYPVDKENNSKFSNLKKIFEKSLAVNKALPTGHQLRFEDLEAKKPKGKGIDASKFRSVIGRTLSKDLQEWDFVNEKDINE